jgi:hypothetical protein
MRHKEGSSPLSHGPIFIERREGCHGAVGQRGQVVGGELEAAEGAQSGALGFGAGGGDKGEADEAITAAEVFP